MGHRRRVMRGVLRDGASMGQFARHVLGWSGFVQVVLEVRLCVQIRMPFLIFHSYGGDVQGWGCCNTVCTSVLDVCLLVRMHLTEFPVGRLLPMIVWVWLSCLRLASSAYGGHACPTLDPLTRGMSHLPHSDRWSGPERCPTGESL